MLIAYDKNDVNEWNECLNKLKNKYELTDNGDVHHMLGMRITRDRVNKKLYIDQQQYVNDKLKSFKMDKCKESNVPGSNIPLHKNTEQASYDTIHEYQQIVGSLIYAQLSTRPDITHAVNMLSRYMTNPSSTHMIAAKKVLRYLKGAINFGLVYTSDINNNDNKLNNNNNINIRAYCDADWGGCVDDRKSTSGFCIFVNNNLVSWATKKQNIVAQSSTEAEYIALSHVIKQILWLKQLLEELQFTVSLPILTFVDNQSSIQMSSNNTDHERTKHIDIKYHFIREHVKNNEIAVKWIATNEQIADIFTKPLGPKLFEKFRDSLLSSISSQQ
jgi:hypothetical protein